MKFPTLEIMVLYGIYTVRDLVLYSQNKLMKRNIQVLTECEKCSYVYGSDVCKNCIKRETRDVYINEAV
jgi:hypothetical protein